MPGRILAGLEAEDLIDGLVQAVRQREAPVHASVRMLEVEAIREDVEVRPQLGEQPHRLVVGEQRVGVAATDPLADELDLRR
ncbi:hypothetical protein [Sorangium cellulosum]|uniref:hypothetical protein n=1 Tax=Sorangium cellulosum TaxID=56 RepID=UPI00138AB107|nr:hypothetical protein [Sorangium cellulosum]